MKECETVCLQYLVVAAGVGLSKVEISRPRPQNPENGRMFPAFIDTRWEVGLMERNTANPEERRTSSWPCGPD